MTVTGQTYGIQIISSTFASGNAFADFTNTSEFRFNNLNGMEVTSASGTFLSAVTDPVNVPEPGAFALFGAGLSGLIIFRRKTAVSIQHFSQK